MSNIHSAYRGKRKSDGKWVFGSLVIEFDATHRICYWLSELTDPETNMHEPVNYCDEVEPTSVGQWTSFNLNGKGVYVGDILKSPHFTEANGKQHFLHHRVRWDSEYMCFSAVSLDNVFAPDLKTNGNVQLWSYFKKDNSKIECIGNIADGNYKHLIA